MINKEYNETAGVYKVQTFGTTHAGNEGVWLIKTDSNGNVQRQGVQAQYLPKPNNSMYNLSSIHLIFPYILGVSSPIAFL